MYKATVTKDLKHFKKNQSAYKAIVFTLLITLPASYISTKVSLASIAAFYGIVYLLLAIWGASGKFKPTVTTGVLLLSEEILSLKWMDDKAIEVPVKDMSLTYAIKSYRLFGFFPKKDYIHLQIKGGPLEECDYFFVHDGEYNTNQWEKLGLQRVDSSQVRIVA